MPVKVFLSHSAADKDDVRRLAEALRANGIATWFDEWEISVGDSITRSVQDGLAEATHLAVWITKRAIESGWVEKEWQTKFEDEVNNGSTLLLPLLAEDCELPGLLRGKKYADFRNSFAVGLKQLLEVFSPSGVPDPRRFVQSLETSDSPGSLPLQHSGPSGIRTPEFTTLRHLKHRDQLNELPHAPFWQDRPELLEVHKWWRCRDDKRICVLVGVGGAGKTALAAQFLNQLHNELPVFIFSFSRNGPDELLVQLKNAIDQGASCSARIPSRPDIGRTADRTYTEVLDGLASLGPCLLVLDALETVQYAGEQARTIGSIRHDRLRDFFKRLVTPEFSNTYVLVSSRYPLGDFYDLGWDQSRAVTVEVGDLPIDACVNLFKAQGINASEYDIKGLLAEHGGHALAVELAGAYTKTFCGGSLLSRNSLHHHNGPWLRGERRVNTLELKLRQIVDSYRLTIARHDPLALDLLQLICVFGEVSLRTLCAVLRKPEHGYKKRLAALSTEAIKRRLAYLEEMRLLRATGYCNTRPSDIMYSVHSALVEPLLAQVPAHTIRRAHRAALGALLLKYKGMIDCASVDRENLFLCDRVIRHSLGCHNWDVALRVYYELMGGYQRVGAGFGEFERGAAICELFEDAARRDPDEFSAETRNQWRNDWALYALHLGDLDRALYLYNILVTTDPDPDEAKRCRWQLNLADVHILSGNLDEAFESAREALATAEARSLFRLTSRAYITCGYIAMLAGSIPDSLQFLAKGLANYRRAELDQPYRKQLFHGVYLAECYFRLGMFDAATAFAEEMKSVLSGSSSNPWTPTYDVVVAGVALAQQKYAAAEQLVKNAAKWGARYRDKFILLTAGIMEARILLCQYDKSRPSQGAGESSRATTDIPTNGRLEHALAIVESTAEIARRGGFGIFLVDLALLKARIALMRSDPEKALLELRFIKESCRENLPGRRVYLWGYARGHQLFAEAILLQVANKLETRSMRRTNVEDMLAIEDAKHHLERSITLRALLGQGRDGCDGSTPDEMLAKLEQGTLPNARP